MFQIRPFQSGDLPGVRYLHDWTPPAGTPTQDTPQQWFPDLDDIPTHYLAFWVVTVEEGGKEQVVGMAGIVPVDGHIPAGAIGDLRRPVRLQRMRILPAFQRHGLGARLVDTVIDWAEGHGADGVILETTRQQAGAVSLYRKRGFAVVWESQRESWDIVWMRLGFRESGAHVAGEK